MVYTFRTPIVYRGTTWREVVLRRPTPKELRQHFNENTVRGVINLLSAMTPIPKPAWREMSNTDANAICAALDRLVEGDLDG